jgi:hypothetical protein
MQNQNNFTGESKKDIIQEQHSTIKHSDIFEPKEGQPNVLCCNKTLCGCPSLRYEYVEATEKLEKAFDILLEETLFKRIRSKPYDFKKNNSNICKGFYS